MCIYVCACVCVCTANIRWDKSQEHDWQHKGNVSNLQRIVADELEEKALKIRAQRSQWINASHLSRATISIWEKWQAQKYIHGSLRQFFARDISKILTKYYCNNEKWCEAQKQFA